MLFHDAHDCPTSELMLNGQLKHHMHHMQVVAVMMWLACAFTVPDIADRPPPNFFLEALHKLYNQHSLEVRFEPSLLCMDTLQWHFWHLQQVPAVSPQASNVACHASCVSTQASMMGWSSFAGSVLGGCSSAATPASCPFRPCAARSEQLRGRASC
jgi:hypothetical protein